MLLFFLVIRFSPFPELRAFAARSWGTVIEDRNGAVLRVVPAADGVKREWADFSAFPQGVIKVFLRAEDRRFYFHFGVDIFAAAAGAVRNAKAKRTVSGASTITMQLARLVRPRPGGLSGKLREAWDALRIEARLSKRQILELWLNSIPFGSNIEGIPAMSRFRFGIPVERLDDARAALLAPVPRNPLYYDPAKNPQAAARAALLLARRIGLGLDADLLLRYARESARAADGGGNTADRGSAAGDPPDHDFIDSDFTGGGASRSGLAEDGAADRVPFYAPHFTGRLYRELLSAGENSAMPHRVRSTLDLQLQQRAENWLDAEIALLAENRVSNGAVLVLENETGAVRAYIGSRSWFDDGISGKIDGVTAENQPGSCLKPFLYALALDSGFSPCDILPDIPSVFGTAEAWIPSNFNNRFNGPVRFRVSLASSLNIPAVYLIERLGVMNTENFLTDLGFDSVRRNAGNYGAGLALGNAEVSLEELVSAFAAFPRGGAPARAAFTEEHARRIAEKYNNIPVMSARAAWLIAGILSDQESRFTGFGAARTFSPARVSGAEFPAMFKTGTANQYQHIWALGATGRYTAGVWMGNFSGETVVGRTGSSIPARIVSRLLAFLESRDGDDGNAAPHVGGPRPEGLLEQEICALSGMASGPYCPGTLREYVQAELFNQNVCGWHRGGSGPVYPPEYQSWLAERRRSGTAGSDGMSNSAAYIRIPAPGSVFYFDPSQDGGSQALRVETAGFGADAFVYADGVLSGALNRAGVFIMPLSPGRHEVMVEDANSSARVWFEVR